MKFTVRELESPPYTVQPASLRRFDARQTAFHAHGADHDGAECLQATDRSGEFMDSAVSAAAVEARRALSSRFFGEQGGGTRTRVDPGDPAAAAAFVKRVAHQAGAFRVGVCTLNPLWVYSHDGSGATVDLGEQPLWVVVMACAMVPAEVRTSPAVRAAAETQAGYLRAALCASVVGQTIRELGFRAFVADNGIGLSIPMAVDAGLGEMGRHGMLITPEFGPCLRLCKVITDLPLQPDKPVSLGMAAFCRKCRRCAKACPAGAIADYPEPTYAVRNACNSAGVLRWPVDALKCHAFWKTNRASCSNCIAACPCTPGVPKPPMR